MEIKLTDYQVKAMIELANQRSALDQRLQDLIAMILDANGHPIDIKVTFDVDKKVLTLGEPKSKK